MLLLARRSFSPALLSHTNTFRLIESTISSYRSSRTLAPGSFSLLLWQCSQTSMAQRTASARSCSTS